MLGDLVRDLRIRQKLSQVEVAERGDFSTAWLSRVEANTIAAPSPNKLRVLARALGVDSDELLIAAGYIRRGNQPPRLEDLSAEELTAQAQRLWDEMSRRATRASQPNSGYEDGVWRPLRGVAADREKVPA